jgi:hypothetical protein
MVQNLNTSRMSSAGLGAIPRSRDPTDCGVYCLVSHDDDPRIQKVGKADGAKGLRQRFRRYTGRKTPAKIASDKTDQRWRGAMTGPLSAECLSVYYYVTKPVKLSPIRFDDGPAVELDGQWARSLEIYLSGLAREEGHPLLLAGIGD